MKLSFREEERAFEAEVEQFVEAHWPADVRGAPVDSPGARRWFDALVARGWTVPTWPVDAGGTAWSATQKFIWERALVRAETPVWDPCGAVLVGPLIMQYGDAAQAARWLPGIRSLATRWCHGLRDPADSASVEQVGERLVASGRIEPVAFAGCAFMLASLRWDPEPGMASLCVVDLDGPGVAFDGAAVVLDGATVADVIGGRRSGAEVLRTVTDHEWTSVRRVSAARLQLDKLKAVLERTPDGTGAMLDEDVDLVRRIADVEVAIASLEALELRVVAELTEGSDPGPRASVLQIKGEEVLLRVGELLVECLGYYALPYPDEYLLHNEGPVGPDYALPAIKGMLSGRSWLAYGGASHPMANLVSGIAAGSDRDGVARWLLGQNDK